MSQTIEKILKQGKENKWPYPKTFQLLKDAGVTTYEVWLANYDNSYKGTFGEWKETPPKGYQPLIVSEVFCQDSIADAICRHQQGETTFVEVMKELALAGVSHYRVDMGQRTVTYFDRNEKNQHQERVPQVDS